MKFFYVCGVTIVLYSTLTEGLWLTISDKQKRQRESIFRFTNQAGTRSSNSQDHEALRRLDMLMNLYQMKSPDPVSYYKEYVDRLNAERAALSADETRPRAFVSPIELYAGHFLLHSLMEELGVKEIIDILASSRNFQFSILYTN